MNDKRGKQICPNCKSSLLAREGNEKIFCLNCNWSIDIKRKDDIINIIEIHETADKWHN